MDVVSGDVTRDPEIVKLNPDSKLPDVAIKVVHRTEGKGSSYIFSDYLSKVSQEFQAKVGRSVSPKWPIESATEGPAISSRGGRTSTQRFPLFSYRTFQTAAEPEADAVVVGVDFQEQEQGISIRGDISGEESGRVFFEEACEAEVGPDRDSFSRARGSPALSTPRTTWSATPARVGSRSRTTIAPPRLRAMGGLTGY